MFDIIWIRFICIAGNFVIVNITMLRVLQLFVKNGYTFFRNTFYKLKSIIRLAYCYRNSIIFRKNRFEKLPREIVFNLYMVRKECSNSDFNCITRLVAPETGFPLEGYCSGQPMFIPIIVNHHPVYSVSIVCARRSARVLINGRTFHRVRVEF